MSHRFKSLIDGPNIEIGIFLWSIFCKFFAQIQSFHKQQSWLFLLLCGILVADFICVCMATLKLFSHSSIGKCLVDKQLKQKQVKTKKMDWQFLGLLNCATMIFSKPSIFTLPQRLLSVRMLPYSS